LDDPPSLRFDGQVYLRQFVPISWLEKSFQKNKILTDSSTKGDISGGIDQLTEKSF